MKYSQVIVLQGQLIGIVLLSLLLYFLTEVTTKQLTIALTSFVLTLIFYGVRRYQLYRQTQIKHEYDPY